MCSICGLLSRDPDEGNFKTCTGMLEATRHRGPDGCGIYVSGRLHQASSPAELVGAAAVGSKAPRVVLGQSRLTITGTPEGRQPFVSTDGRLALAHNGEVYNHRELRKLLSDPSSAATGSDSEVLMRVLEQNHVALGRRNLKEAVKRTVLVASGMYALAVTDGESVVLARDSVGKKPLYYLRNARIFAFASERKALREIAGRSGGVIERLRPGEVLACGPDMTVDIESVEHLSAPAIDIDSMDAAVSLYREVLERSIERRTRGVSRVAVFFSGGVDSALVARLLQLRGIQVTGYAAGVAASPDLEVAKRAAAEMGLTLKTVELSEEEVARELPLILRAVELNGPMQIEVSVPMWYCAKAAHRDGHRVIFTGQAADELFAGYEWYGKVLSEKGPLNLHARMWEDVRELPLDTLEREDRITMAWSLELRAPFLDPDVVRAAMRMSPRLKIFGPDDTMRKHPHRLLALAVGVPPSAASREKAPAQDGANVHDLLEYIAKRAGVDPATAGEITDFGSNYRYRDPPGTYGSAEVRALLAQLTRSAGALVAGVDGRAVVAAVPRIPVA